MFELKVFICKGDITIYAGNSCAIPLIKRLKWRSCLENLGELKEQLGDLKPSQSNIKQL